MESASSREDILASFEACTGIKDIAYSISLLDAHEWDLSAAVNSALVAGVSDDGSDVPMEHDGAGHVIPKPSVDSGSTSCGAPGFSHHSRSSSTASTGTCTVPGQLTDNDPVANAVMNQQVLEVDSGVSRGVRILNFEIRLQLPEDCGGVTVEYVTFPETETVLSLKRHFIEAKMPELIQLATSPQWLAGVDAPPENLEFTLNSLIGHLQLKPANLPNSDSFSNQRATLRELHLPKFNTLDAALAYTPEPPSTSRKKAAGGGSSRGTSLSPVELKILVTPYSAAAAPSVTSSVPATTTTTTAGSRSKHFLRTPVSTRLAGVRQDVSSLTGISPARQFWWLPTSHHRDPVACQLVSQLCQHGDGLAAAEGQSGEDRVGGSTLASVGMRPGSKCTLYLSDTSTVEPDHHQPAKNNGGKKEHNRGGHVPQDSHEPSGSVSVGRTERSARLLKRVSNSTDQPFSADGAPSANSPSVSAGNDDDYPGISDDYMSFSEGEPLAVFPQPSIWTVPLIPDTDSVDDPTVATEHFRLGFLQRYCDDGAAMAPPFAPCSMDAALAASVGMSTVSSRKPFFAYLHHDKSVACHVFCQQVLCSTGFTRFIGENDFSIWPWDMTTPRAKERLTGWLENRIPNLASILTHLSVDSLPVLAMVGKLAGQLEILCVVLGTGRIINSAVLHANSTGGSSDPFPPLMFDPTETTVRSQPPTNTPGNNDEAESGQLNADMIVAHLSKAYAHYLETLQPEREAESERRSRQLVREEQEAAYQESLENDRRKAMERARAAEEERRKQERLEEEKRQAADEAARHRRQMTARLLAEPPCPTTPEAQAWLATARGSAGIASLRFRFPAPETQPNYAVAAGPPEGAPRRSCEIVTRRFAGNDSLQAVLTFMESRGYRVNDYKLLTTFPTKDLTQLPQPEKVTLAELKFVPQMTLTLELR